MRIAGANADGGGEGCLGRDRHRQPGDGERLALLVQLLGLLVVERKHKVRPASERGVQAVRRHRALDMVEHLGAGLGHRSRHLAVPLAEDQPQAVIRDDMEVACRGARGARAGSACLQDDNGLPVAGKELRGGDARDAPADDTHVGLRLPVQRGKCARGRGPFPQRLGLHAPSAKYSLLRGSRPVH